MQWNTKLGRRLWPAGAVLAIMLTSLPMADIGAQERESWSNYKNERFGFRLRYPSSVFKEQPPSERGDGQTFVTDDGRAKIVAYGTINDEGFSPAEYRKTILQEFGGGYDRMDYFPRGKTWFVLSGFRGESIYYQKVMFSCGNRVINVLSVTFPTAEKQYFENLVEKIEDNFKPGSGEGCRRG